MSRVLLLLLDMTVLLSNIPLEDSGLMMWIITSVTHCPQGHRPRPARSKETSNR
jgi:hypothetical protein